VRIEVDRKESFYDQPVAIRIHECPPGAAVTVRAAALDDLQRRWESQAVFMAGPHGTIDLARDAASSGTYPGRDAMGLFWSLRLDPAVEERGPFVKLRPTPVTVTISAECQGNTAAAEIIRRLMWPGVRRSEIRENGMIATLFDHEGDKRAGIITLSGSGGGLPEDQPALLASRGYAVLSLAYFGTESLPQDLIGIPLEYFGRAIEWMRTRDSVDPERIAVMGASRGGELALLLGAMFPAIKAVVAYVPSGVVWPGIARTPSPHPQAAWTLGGEALPSMPSPTPDPQAWSKPPVVLAPSFLEALKSRAPEQAEIAVEKINGPVLMFSGSDDQMWPSLALADIAAQRLLRADFPHRFEHVTYAGAGHFIRFPYSPVITEIFHPLVRTMMALGGDPVANAAADLDSWRRLLGFLAASL
jgi:dienelactone hydrolase